MAWTIFENLESEGAKKNHIFKLFKSKSIIKFMVPNVLNIFMVHDLNILMIFGIK